MIHPNMLCPGCLMVNTTKCSDTSNMRPAASNITYHVKIILWTNRNINDSRITQTNIVILMDLAFLPKWGSASEAKEKPQFTLHLQFIYCISPGNEKQQILEFILLFSFGNKKHEWNSFQGSNKDQNSALSVHRNCQVYNFTKYSLLVCASPPAAFMMRADHRYTDVNTIIDNCLRRSNYKP